MFFICYNTFGQSPSLGQQVDNLLSDALFYTNKFISPSVDAAIYQSSSSWMNTPRKREFGTFDLGLHGNVFFVPKNNRSFVVSQSDLSFFELPNNQPVEMPTAFGEDVDYSFTGNLGGIPLSISAPNGVNQEQIVYPFLQGTFALWSGFEVVARYSTKVNLKRGDFQVYGFGLKHNFSQYIDYLEKKDIHLAVLVSRSFENVNFDFIETNVQFLGDIGLNRISGDVSTWQFQINGSKVWNRFELILSSITNVSNVKYSVSGNQSSLSQSLPIQSILNDQLKKQYETKINSVTEISGRYQISDFHIQSSFAFGKFANLNLGVQYQF